MLKNKENCDYCNKEFIKNRNNQRFCKDSCRKRHHQWINNRPKSPYKMDLKRPMTLLLEIAQDVNKLYLDGNYVAEQVIKAIELQHFEVIRRSDVIYLLNKSKSPHSVDEFL